MARALIILADGYTDSEATYALDRCREEDIDVHVATPTGKNPVGEMGWSRIKADFSTLNARMVAQDSMTWQRVNEPFVHGLWDILLLPGGVKSIERVRIDAPTIEIIKLHHAADKIIGSICHGAQNLIEAEVVSGRQISGYKSIRKDIINAGAEYVDGVVVDGNIISAPHYDLNGKWMQAVIRAWQWQERNEQRA